MSAGASSAAEQALRLLQPEVAVLEGPGAGEWYGALGVAIAELATAHDHDALVAVATGIRRVMKMARPLAAARLVGILDVAAPLKGQLAAKAVSSLEPGQLAARFLTTVEQWPGISNNRLVAILGTDETQISRAGRRLIDDRLVDKDRAGRLNMWRITPEGKNVAASLRRAEAVRA